MVGQPHANGLINESLDMRRRCGKLIELEDLKVQVVNWQRPSWRESMTQSDVIAGMPASKAYQLSRCKRRYQRLSRVRSVLKWGELVHVLFAVNKEFDTKVGSEDVTVRCTGEGGVQAVP